MARWVKERVVMVTAAMDCYGKVLEKVHSSKVKDCAKEPVGPDFRSAKAVLVLGALAVAHSGTG